MLWNTEVGTSKSLLSVLESNTPNPPPWLESKKLRSLFRPLDAGWAAGEVAGAGDEKKSSSRFPVVVVGAGGA